MRKEKVGRNREDSNRLRTAHKRAHRRWHGGQRRKGFVHVSEILADVLEGIGLPRDVGTPGRKHAG
jgi:hypothetical protein